MTSLPSKPTLLLATLLLAGCGGGDGNEGAGGTGGRGDDRGLVVNAALGFTIVESPLDNEAPVIGSALVTRDGDGLTDADVTLNGATLAPDNLLLGFYNARGTGAEVHAGETMVLEASHGGETASISFPCPPDVAITAPADGASFSEGDAIAVRWSGEIHYNKMVFLPFVTIRGYDVTDNEVDGGFPEETQQAVISTTHTSVTVVAPETTGDGYVLDLSVPGAFADDAGRNAGICYLQKRVRLVKN
jgi:hypothetical protein